MDIAPHYRSAALRRDLDLKLEKMQAAAKELRSPSFGWIHLMRKALWMSSSEFARLLEVAPSSATRLEDSEMNGTISLQSLQRAANVLGCELVYALVPRQPLKETMRNRAMETLERRGQIELMAKQIKVGRLTMKSAERSIESKITRLLREPKFWTK